MMSAGRAGELARACGRGPESKNPLRILLVEKNDSLGKKLLITGGGRCNVTNAEFDDRILLTKFKDAGKFLFSAFSQYSVKNSLDFFNGHGMATKVEPGKRVFPVSDSARSVWEVMLQYLNDGGVTVRSNCTVTGFEKDESGKISAIIIRETSSKADSIKKTTTASKTDGASKIFGKTFILATGGKSHPETGSTGEGFAWLKDIGHKVNDQGSALVPIETSDAWSKKLSGIALPEAKITVFQDGQKQQVIKGKMLFTHFGLSGPAILNASTDIGELMRESDVELSLDLLPQHDYATLNKALQDLFTKEHIKKFKNAIDGLIPSAFVPVILEKSGIDGDKQCNSVTRDERLDLVKVLKDIRLHPTGLLDADKAIVTSGGVDLTEVDFKTMCSKIVPNLFLVGDVLDIDRPSGGYSLQICWTTGSVAGTHVIELLT